MYKIQFSVGDLIQRVDYKTKLVSDGIIKKISPAKIKLRPIDFWNLSKEKQKEYITFVNIKWENNSSSKEDIDFIEPRDSEIERQFRNTAFEMSNLIDIKVQLAITNLEEAIKISELYGIPFESSVSRFPQSYNPVSLRKIFPTISNSKINDITGCYREDYEYNKGWEHSQIC